MSKYFRVRKEKHLAKLGGDLDPPDLRACLCFFLS